MCEFEYTQLLESYHRYFELVEKGISIYIVVMGACLSLPYTLKPGSADLKKFKEAFFRLALVVSVFGILGYFIAGCSLLRMNCHARVLARELNIDPPNTWIMPMIIFLACIVAGIVVGLVMPKLLGKNS